LLSFLDFKQWIRLDLGHGIALGSNGWTRRSSRSRICTSKISALLQLLVVGVILQ
jgi:hypothetical protein